MQVDEGTPLTTAHVSEVSSMRREQTHTYDPDGFSNETFSFSSNVGCFAVGGKGVIGEDGRLAVVCGRPIRPSAMATAPVDANNRSFVVVVSSVDDSDDFRRQLHATMDVSRLPAAVVCCGVDRVVEDRVAEDAAAVAGMICVRGALLPLLPADDWSRTAVVVAPLSIGGAACVPCRVFWISPRDEMKRLTWSNIVDASQLVTEDVPFYPGGKALTRCPFVSQHHVKRPQDELTTTASTWFECGCDLGTHVDSPSHFVPGGRRASDIKPTELLLPTRIVDVVSQCGASDAPLDYGVTVDDIVRHEALHGTIPHDALVCMRSGWGGRFSDPVAYKGCTDGEELHFPAFTYEAVRWLVENRSCKAIGVDSLSTDVGSSSDFPVHTYFLAADGFQVENLMLENDLLTASGGRGWYALVMPWNVEGAFEIMSRVVFIDFTLDGM